VNLLLPRTVLPRASNSLVLLPVLHGKAAVTSALLPEVSVLGNQNSVTHHASHSHSSLSGDDA